VTYASVKSTMTQSLICDGQVSKTYKAGEVFTITGVNAVNPRTKADLGYLKQFTILADATSDGSGNVTLSIAPAIISSGAFQNVSAAPADNAALTHLGALSTTFRPNAVFHKTAIKLVSAKLVRPFSGEADYATDPDTGITVRYWRYSDGANDTAQPPLGCVLRHGLRRPSPRHPRQRLTELGGGVFGLSQLCAAHDVNVRAAIVGKRRSFDSHARRLPHFAEVS
jgi:hypothetical protein